MDIVCVLADRAAAAIFAERDGQAGEFSVQFGQMLGKILDLVDIALAVPADIAVEANGVCDAGQDGAVVVLARPRFATRRARRRVPRVLAPGEPPPPLPQRDRVGRRQPLPTPVGTLLPPRPPRAP